MSFDPLALLLDASLEGELELVKKVATEVADASAANDEGITGLSVFVPPLEHLLEDLWDVVRDLPS